MNGVTNAKPTSRTPSAKGSRPGPKIPASKPVPGAGRVSSGNSRNGPIQSAAIATPQSTSCANPGQPGR